MEPEVVLEYRSGEEIKKGDRVLHHGEPDEIELVALELGDPETDWYVQEYGGGIMIEDAIFGHAFISADQPDDADDLEFVSRAPATDI